MRGDALLATRAGVAASEATQASLSERGGAELSVLPRAAERSRVTMEEE